MKRNKINMNVKVSSETQSSLVSQTQVSQVNNGKSKLQKNEINNLMSAY